MLRKLLSVSYSNLPRLESLLASLDEVLGLGLVLAERLGDIAGMGSRRHALRCRHERRAHQGPHNSATPRPIEPSPAPLLYIYTTSQPAPAAWRPWLIHPTRRS